MNNKVAKSAIERANRGKHGEREKWKMSISMVILNDDYRLFPSSSPPLPFQRLINSTILEMQFRQSNSKMAAPNKCCTFKSSWFSKYFFKIYIIYLKCKHFVRMPKATNWTEKSSETITNRYPSFALRVRVHFCCLFFFITKSFVRLAIFELHKAIIVKISLAAG